MASTTETCPDCGDIVDINFGSRCVDGRLAWSASHRCRDCSHALEMDDWDTTPEPYRDLELAQDGEWSVQLPPSGYAVAAALQTIRKHGRLSIAQISEVKKRIPLPVLAGTQAEMAVIAFHLSESGIDADVVKTEAKLD